MRGAWLGVMCTVCLLVLRPADADDVRGGRFVVGEPVTVRNLTIYPLRASEAVAAPNADYLTLDEGIAAKQVAIAETGNVPRLQITNGSDRPLFLMAGEMVKGGKQDRIIAANITIAAKSSGLVPVFCVEQGRWTHQADFTTTGGLVHGKLRCVAQQSKDQGEVWREVGCNNGKLGTDNPTSTYRATFDDAAVAKLLEGYLAPLREATADPRITGVCVAISGKLAGGDAYASPRLFAALRDKLLRSYAIDALTRLPEAIEATDAASLRLRALCWSGQGQNDKALAALERAATLDPSDAVAPLAQARILALLGRLDEALVACDRAVARAAESLDARRVRVDVLLDLGATRLAMTDLAWLAERGPRTAEAWALEGYCHHRLGSEGDAVACYVRALAIEPDHKVSRFNRGVVLARAGDLERAKVELGWVRKHAPELTRFGYGQQRMMRQWGGAAPQQEANQDDANEQGIENGQPQDGSGSSRAAPEVTASAALDAYVAMVAKRDSPVDHVRPARAADEGASHSPRQALDALAALPLKVPPIAVAEVERLLAEADGMPVTGQDQGNFQFESPRCVGFGTGGDRAKLLHLNWHCK